MGTHSPRNPRWRRNTYNVAQRNTPFNQINNILIVINSIYGIIRLETDFAETAMSSDFKVG